MSINNYPESMPDNLHHSIRFLKLMRRGYNPETLFVEAYTKREAELYQEVNDKAVSLIIEQLKVQEAVTQRMKKISSLEDLKPSIEMVEALKLKKEKLQEVLGRLIEITSSNRLQIEEKRQNILTLNNELALMRENLKRIPPLQPQQGIAEVGEFLCGNVSQLTRDKLKNEH